MGTGYTRNDSANNIADGNVINASDLDGEFDAVQAAFNGTTGHSHDGTTGEGPQIATGGLADNAVTTVKITDANVTTAKIADSNVTTAKIADSNVTTAKIADSNVTLAKMAANSVDSDQYVDGSIDRVHLAADIIDGTKIADDSIDSEHYVDGSIDTAHIGNLQVTNAKIAADAIDGTKLADNAVNSEHYTDGSIDRVHLAADIVDGTKIADDSIDSEHYVDGSIDTAHIANDAVTGDKLANNIQIAGTLGVTGETTLTTHLNMGDNDIIKLGASADLQIYHDASNSYISDTGTGNLFIQASNNLILESATGENYLAGVADGSVTLYHNAVAKIATTNTGIEVTGNIAVTGTVDGRDVASDGSKLDGIESGATADQTASEILTLIKTVDGAGSGLDADTLDGVSSASFLRSDAEDTKTAGALNFNDNILARFGTGQDLQIYHDGSNSYIIDQGTGQLRIRASNLQLQDSSGHIYIEGVDTGTGGTITLYHNAVAKLATASDGITVTGNINGATDIFVEDQIIHTGDTDTYTQFHAANEWRVVTGGTEMLEVNDNYILLGANSVGKVQTTNVASSLSPNMYLFNSFVLTLTGNINLTNPTTEVTGMSGVFIIIQDGTGGRTVSLGTDYETVGGAGLTLSTAPNAVDIVPFYVQSSGNVLLGTPQLAFS